MKYRNCKKKGMELKKIYIRLWRKGDVKRKIKRKEKVWIFWRKEGGVREEKFW